MSTVAAVLNLALGVVYVSIGTMISLDLEKAIRRRGWSHFGVAWLTIMFTCGAHHLVHGLHLGAEGRAIGVLDIVTVGVGLPAGVIWSMLRIEAVRGGRGDRYVRATPRWLRGLAAGYAAVALAAAVGAVVLLTGSVVPDARVLPNLMLVVLYLGIFGVLLRGQLGNRATLGGWSLSGMALMMIFYTCALMHGVYVLYASAGAFAPDAHGLWVDWASVPAGLYFFWVVRGLETGTLTDWNDRFEAIEDLGTPAAAPEPDLAGVGG